MGLFDLFDRKPRDLVDAAAEEQEKLERKEAREDAYYSKQERKYARKGLKRTAKALGLENVRHLEPSATDRGRLVEVIEGDLLVAGETVTLSLAASANVRTTTGIIGSKFEYRSVEVDVKQGQKLLGKAWYEYSSNFLDSLEERFGVARSAYSFDSADKGEFLSQMAASIQRRRDEQRQEREPGAPVLSSLETASASREAPAPGEHSLGHDR